MQNLRPLLARLNQFYKTNPRRGLIAGCLSLFMLCCCGTVLASQINAMTPGYKATRTAEALFTATSTKTARPTATTRPTRTSAPTKTPFSTNTLRPSSTIRPSSTPADTLTSAPGLASTLPPKPQATKPPTSSSCNCARDYNCPDFGTQRQAQSCFSSCNGSKTNNWSGLDSDHDGKACENLP